MLNLAAGLTAYAVLAQVPTIRVPVRLVTVPTLVFSRAGNLVPGLEKENFELLDDGHPQSFRFETEVSPLSIAVAVQTSQSVRAYLPFVAKIGNTLDNSLVAETGEAAVLAFEDEVTVLKPFGSGDIETALQGLSAGGEKARLFDAAMEAIALLGQRPASRSKVLLIIGQQFDKGSSNDLAGVLTSAEQENVSVYALVFPMFGKNFISDTFTLQGLGSQGTKGGYIATVEVTEMGPALKRSTRSVAGADPLSIATAQTGGMSIHFRRQHELENALIAMGGALRSTYVLSYTPEPPTPGEHSIAIRVNVPGATAHSRTGYRID